MPKVDVHYADYVKPMFELMSTTGILLVSNNPQGRPNPMTIGWGTVGVVWGRPMFVALVRPSRYTYECLEHSGDFTINVQPKDRKDWVDLCGSVSGRDRDKLAELGLTAVPAKHVSTPIIKECRIHYECRVVHHNDIILGNLEEDIISEYYPERDHHRVYYGQILRSCIEKGLPKP